MDFHSSLVDHPVGNLWGECLLGDKRLVSRASFIGAKMLEKPDCLLPQQMGSWSATKSSYRFLDNDSISYASLLLPHWKSTKDVSTEHETVLCIQDTSDISFTHRVGIEGLSQLGNGQGQGFLLHSTLAVVPQAQPRILGLLHQEIYYRKPKPRDETKKDRYMRKRESDVWINALQAVGIPPASTRYIDVMDRGADIYRVIETSISQKRDFIIRVAYNRKLAQEDKKLFDLMKDTAPLGIVRLAVPKRQKKRLAVLAVASKNVILHPPYPQREGVPMPCTVVYAKEKNAPKGVEPVEWVILTSLDGTTLQESCKILDWYAMRWIIEEYHKCLKTGCKLEQRQLKNSERIERLTGFLAVVALRLLHLREQMKNGEHQLAKNHVPGIAFDILAKRNNMYAQTMTVKQFWIEVAKLGGFLARKNDRDPGWITLWRGWNDLEKMCDGARLMRCG